jgi:hypothetical protein
MNAIWIERLEPLSPLPVPEAARAVDLLQAADVVAAG